MAQPALLRPGDVGDSLAPRPQPFTRGEIELGVGQFIEGGQQTAAHIAGGLSGHIAARNAAQRDFAVVGQSFQAACRERFGQSGRLDGR
jgi:hypothetical protein